MTVKTVKQTKRANLVFMSSFFTSHESVQTTSPVINYSSNVCFYVRGRVPNRNLSYLAPCDRNFISTGLKFSRPRVLKNNISDMPRQAENVFSTIESFAATSVTSDNNEEKSSSKPDQIDLTACSSDDLPAHDQFYPRDLDADLVGTDIQPPLERVEDSIADENRVLKLEMENPTTKYAAKICCNVAEKLIYFQRGAFRDKSELIGTVQIGIDFVDNDTRGDVHLKCRLFNLSKEMLSPDVNSKILTAKYEGDISSGLVCPIKLRSNIPELDMAYLLKYSNIQASSNYQSLTIVNAKAMAASKGYGHVQLRTVVLLNPKALTTNVQTETETALSEHLSSASSTFTTLTENIQVLVSIGSLFPPTVDISAATIRTRPPTGKVNLTTKLIQWSVDPTTWDENQQVKLDAVIDYSGTHSPNANEETFSVPPTAPVMVRGSVDHASLANLSIDVVETTVFPQSFAGSLDDSPAPVHLQDVSVELKRKLMFEYRFY